ncbi:hypothetical protein Dalk_4593 [Desulfatibacillum aliphaticivorans]|uniref:Uncharacterized protein n=1 Tax=Desulfatibacillum aliphaticivorans TaxID=218208 RepID=B8FNJ0_DESAL|nr:hypothetical protein [Desulfatibacillum aliphaticivorans]ACL06271.1 hypothetical protein Dalk_4593 [Desulfatibacillum aliphaticivorans]
MKARKHVNIPAIFKKSAKEYFECSELDTVCPFCFDHPKDHHLSIDKDCKYCSRLFGPKDEDGPMCPCNRFGYENMEAIRDWAKLVPIRFVGKEHV